MRIRALQNLVVTRAGQGGEPGLQNLGAALDSSLD